MFSIARLLRRASARCLITGLFVAGGSYVHAEDQSQLPPGVLPAALFPSTASQPGTLPAASAVKDAAPAAEATTGSVAPAPGACAAPGCGCCGFDWTKVPEVRIFPRPGWFYVPPTGPGYYSLCDALTGKCLQDPPKFPRGPTGAIFFSFFDADYRYLDDPNNTQHDPLDFLHRIHLGDNWMFDTGGEFRYRHMDEGHSRLMPKRNNYDLYRVREYADLWYKDMFRFYVEGIYADSGCQDLPVLPIDANKGDFQNLFIDVKLAEIDGHNAYVRVGRQEMLLGSERLISPLDWANTRRTFQGVRAFYQGEKFDIDGWWTRPVIPEANKLDSWDDHQDFAGVWATYRPKKGTALDAYYLYLDNSNNKVQLTGPASVRLAPITVHTIGGRFSGDNEGFLWDGESAIQLGDQQTRDVLSGMATGGLGYNAKDLPMNPTVWGYYDWASGTRNPGGNNYSTFNQLFPFGHYYFGFADQVGRQNIQDLSGHLYLNPTKWIVVNAQYHHFWLDENKDALYNAGGNAIRRSPAGTAGNNVGDEVDLLTNFHLDAHSDILIGYSKLFGGSFLANTGSKIQTTDLFYVQYSFKW